MLGARQLSKRDLNANSSHINAGARAFRMLVSGAVIASSVMGGAALAQQVVTEKPAMQMSERKTLDLQLQNQFHAQYVAASKYARQMYLGVPTGYADETTANAKIKAPLIRTLTQINSLFRAYNAGKDFIDLTQIAPGYLSEETLSGIERQADRAFMAEDDAMMQSIGSQPAISVFDTMRMAQAIAIRPRPAITASSPQPVIAPWIRQLVAARIQHLQLAPGEAAVYRQIADELDRIASTTAPSVKKQTRLDALKTRDIIEANLMMLEEQPAAADAASSIRTLQRLRQDYEKNARYARALMAAREAAVRNAVKADSPANAATQNPR